MMCRSLICCVLAAMAMTQSANAELVLWNKLGSESEVLNSEVGPDFGIRPGLLYVPGRFGGALATTGGGNGGGAYLTMSPDDFYPADKTRGTIEFWIQKRFSKFTPFQDGLIGFFGRAPYAPTGEGNRSIAAFWSDGFTGNGGVEFYIQDSNKTGHTVNDLGWDDVPVGEWVHLGFVWDLQGIDGTADRLRIYRDGSITGVYSQDISGISAENSVTTFAGHHAYSRFGQPAAYFDDLVIWDFAKTDFSDRFIEGRIPEPASLSALALGGLSLLCRRRVA